ncbi:MAG: hypothetical protein M3N13_10665, partial [Candidatus Eremiobacteraeota bacterium]|nr:hypothetical protein [Candidatus Eremiobacteraeota bacterium]
VGLLQLASGNDLTQVTSDGFSSQERVKALGWGLEKTLGESLTIAAIYDRDYHCDEEIATILSQLRSQIRFAHIHARKELENYLLVPNVLQRALDREISDRQKRNGSPIIVNETIERLLLRLSQPTKARLFGRYSAQRSRHFEKSQYDDATITEQTMDWFESRWSNIATRMEIVAGKELLKSVRDELQQTFGVSLTDHRIIDAFRVEEIPTDLVDLLQGLDRLRGRSTSS